MRSSAVFLSYASEDVEAARRLTEALRATGVEIWFDESELRGGDAWDHKIRQQIRDCALFVPVISAATEARAEGYFRLEWRLAHERSYAIGHSKAFLFPVCIDDTSEADADVPASFVAVQWTRTPAGRVDAAFCARVREVLDGRRTPARASVATLQPPGRRRTWFAAAGSILATALAIVAWVAWRGERTAVNAPAGSSVAAHVYRSLAVLPLANLSGNPAQDYFAQGMTEELITDLAKIAALKVISHTSVLRYKGTKQPLPRIAHELGVDAIVEGSVQREGGHVRITTQLIDGRTDQNLWSESYDRDLRSVLALQAEVARAVAAQVKAVVTPAERARLTHAPSVNPEAYEAYLKGKSEWVKATPAGLDAAMKQFHLALAKNPDYAPAYVGIAQVWGGRQQMGIVAPAKATPLAKAAALRAIELDGNLAEAHGVLANILAWIDWDWGRAEVEFRRALELNPNDALAHGFYSHLLMILGRQDEAMDQIHRAIELDPFNPLLLSLYSIDLVIAGRYDTAVAESRKALAIVPDHPVAETALVTSLWLQGKPDDVFAEESKEAVARGDQEMVRALTEGRRHGGFRGAMHAAADLLARRSSARKIIPSVDIGMSYVMAGDNDRALEWLEKGFAARDPNIPYVPVFPVYDGLHSDPRFRELARRLKLPLKDK